VSKSSCPFVLVRADRPSTIRKTLQLPSIPSALHGISIVPVPVSTSSPVVPLLRAAVAVEVETIEVGSLGKYYNACLLTDSCPLDHSSSRLLSWIACRITAPSHFFSTQICPSACCPWLHHSSAQPHEKVNTDAVQLMHIVCDRFLDPSKHEAHCAATPLKNTPVRTGCAYFLALFHPLTRHLHSEATCSQNVLPSQTLAFNPITSPKTV
jgi:hypothetical protein